MTSKKMRSRSNSGQRLDYYQRIVYRTILDHQNPVSGLLPTTTTNDHAWVRDNVYSILAVWGLSMAYKKNADLDEDRAKTYELEQSCVKLMRGLLMAMIRQVDKVEKFKETQSPSDALHAKYSASTISTVVGDADWGHLQLDATSLYLLILAQMTASGLQIIFNLDEVAFIQNLVFYIELSYCVPDYGIWERGDKTNHGLPELNGSSIGLAKAALEAMNELDLFGGRGGPSSVIHVLPDNSQKCHAVLQSMLPRESNSKEVDAALLPVIGFPAFAVEDAELIDLTRKTIITKLGGRYGCKRFLRDGYRTAREDPTRLYYEPWELKVFENIECEWPLFFCYLILDACFFGDIEAAEQYAEQLDKILIKRDDGIKLVPEQYTVTAEKVELEYKDPHSQDRVPIGQLPFMWAQSLYIISRLLLEGFIAVGELDPLNRRLGANKRPDVVVQVVILAEDIQIQEKLRHHDIIVQMADQVSSIEIHPAGVLSHLYSFLGKHKKLNLSGRKSLDVGLLSTSKLYKFEDRTLAFTPQFADPQRYYVASDVDLLFDSLKNEIAFLKQSWRILGRPVVVLRLGKDLIDQEHDRIPMSMLTTLRKIKSGYINDTRVALGTFADFLSTSCITDLSFLSNIEEGDPDGLGASVKDYLKQEADKKKKPLKPIRKTSSHSKTMRTRPLGLAGIIKRSRSIQVDQFDPELAQLRDQYAKDERWRGLPTSVSSHNIMDMSNLDNGLRSNYNRSANDISLSSFVAEEPEHSLDDAFLIERRHLPNRLSPHPPSLLITNPSNPSSPNENRTKLSDLQIDENVSDEDIIQMFKDAESLDEQGDLLHYLVYNKGMNWRMTVTDEDLGTSASVSVNDMVKDMYEKACKQKKWALVRHIAGILDKHVEDLAKSLTDLLVRQKQVTVGMPPHYEYTISRPMTSKDLRAHISRAHGGDQSTAMLTQEMLVYLAMFIRTEPRLFSEMLRLRVGLIIQVMASELGRSLKCSGDEASDHLLNLSPFEVKTLLHHILSGREFDVKHLRSGLSLDYNIEKNEVVKSMVSIRSRFLSTASNLFETGNQELEDYESENDREGQWLRRRRLDGALNRVPVGFYPRVWSLLERCHGISINGRVLMNQLTREMTSGELKFALQVEQVLTSVPQPEYRQLMVEALMVLTLMVENNIVNELGQIIEIEQIVRNAHEIYLNEQRRNKGNSTRCCAPLDGGLPVIPCGGAAEICQRLYDSPPSGTFGTMTYLMRSYFCRDDIKINA